MDFPIQIDTIIKDKERTACVHGSCSWYRALNWGSKGGWFEPNLGGVTCFVSLIKTLYLLLSTGSTQEDPYWKDWKIVDLDVKNKLNKQKAIIKVIGIVHYISWGVDITLVEISKLCFISLNFVLP